MSFHKHIFGFQSVDEFITTLTGVKYKAPAVFNLLLSIEVSMLSLLVAWIENWVWSPMYTLVFYAIVLSADFLSGIMVGVKVRHEGFLTQKAQRLPIILACHLVLLGLLYNAERINTDIGFADINPIFFSGIARGFYFYTIGVNLVSFVKNLVMLGYVKGAVAQFFEKNIDTQKNVTDGKV